MIKQVFSTTLLLTAFTFLFAHSVCADSVTVTDSCATLTITSSEPAADGSYSIALDGTVLGGYYYMSQVFMDGGLIASGWKRSGDTVVMDVTIPANTRAAVHVPAQRLADVRGLDEVHSARMTGRAAVLEVDPGRYRFVSSCSPSRDGEK